MTAVLPNSFRITCSADGIAASGLLILITIRMNRKNHYSVIVGPTNHDGQVTVTKSDLENEIENTQNQFPIDYAAIAESFSGQLEIRPMTLRQLQSAVDAHHLWQGIQTYPTGHLDRLIKGMNSLKTCNPHRLTVAIDDTSTLTPAAILVPASVSDPVAELTSTVAI